MLTPGAAGPAAAAVSGADEQAPVVVVTGAAGQIGRAVCTRLAERGARLVLVDRDAQTLEQARAGLPQVPASSLSLDLTADAPGTVFGHATAAFGQVDALVNNAGIEGPLGLLEQVDAADVARVFEINVFALMRLSAVFAAYFRRRRAGRIVNLASGAGLSGTAMMAAYSASKHAVVGVTRSMAQELAAANVSVNAVCPGCVESAMMYRIEARLTELSGSGQPVSFLGSIPMGRYCQPDEVGEVVRWLVLEAPAYLTGTTLVLDGGMRA